MPKEVKVTVVQVGNDTGVNVQSEGITDPFEAIQILGIAIQALQQKLVDNSRIIFPPPGGIKGVN